MAHAEGSQPEKVAAWKDKIDGLVGALNKEANLQRNLVEAPLVFDGSTKPDAALAYIWQVKPDVLELEKRAKEYDYYQTVLKLPVLPCTDVDELLASLRLIEAVWRGFDEIASKEGKWHDAPIADIDEEELQELLHRYTMLIAQGGRSLPSNSVVPKLGGRI
eukprot:5868802-Prymnesium_polylepis.1